MPPGFALSNDSRRNTGNCHVIRYVLPDNSACADQTPAAHFDVRQDHRAYSDKRTFADDGTAGDVRPGRDRCVIGNHRIVPDRTTGMQLYVPSDRDVSCYDSARTNDASRTKQDAVADVGARVLKQHEALSEFLLDPACDAMAGGGCANSDRD